MTDLLIHSMSEFADLILEALALADAREIAEIGCEFGGMTQRLADYARARGGSLVTIDPAPKPAFVEWLATAPEVSHVAATSLEALPTMQAADAWIVDGDHNWYTVFNELTQIEAISRRAERPLLIFLHDVAWPWARRDLYYAPDEIPAAFRHPFDYESGTRPGDPGLTLHRGFRGLGQFAAALYEGGPRNGVLTAIEDFLETSAAAGRELGFAEIPAVFGLGVIFDLDAPWSGEVAQLLLPFHQNRLLRTLEQNRLANYLRVLDYQDAGASV